VAEGEGQNVCVVIKRTGNTYLIANVNIGNGNYSVVVKIVQAGVETTLATSDLEGANLASGFLRLSYEAESRKATCRVIPSGGSQVTLAATLSEAQDNNLGQNSAIGIINASLLDQPEILQVTGGGLGS
jgi:hypothetical protein